MKRLTCLSSIFFLLVSVLSGCNKEDYKQDNFNPDMGEMVSYSQTTNQHGSTILETIYENGSRLYFQVMSDATLKVVNYSYYYNESYDKESEYLFKGNLVIPESIEAMGKTIPVTSMAAKAFYKCKGMLSAVLPNNITIIPELAFGECSNLKEIHLPDSLQSIGNEAFVVCGLTEIDIPPATKAIGYHAFTSCHNLSEIIFHNGLQNIGIEAFSYCKAESVTIPTSVRKVNYKAFYGYTKYLTFLSQVPPEIGTEDHGGVIINKDNLIGIKVPRTAIESYRLAPTWKNLYSYYLIGID